MKALSKPPLSSPGRAEKLPTPLMVRLFLRNNGGSRSSRGKRAARSRSPMFYSLRSKKSAAIDNNPHQQQEPSSPTVTCIGQVRVRRSKGKKKRCGGASVEKRRRWWRRSFCCRKAVSLKLLLWSKKNLIRWGLFFRAGYCRKVDASEDSFRVGNRRRSCNKNGSFESSGSDGGDGFRRSCSGLNNSENALEISCSKRGLLEDEHIISSSPPKNALLLTRCRSAPYRSSSLAGKLWNPPSTEAEGGDERGGEGDENPRLENSGEDPRISEESSKGSMEKASVSSKSNSIHPLLLTRCKSEPARTGVRLIDDSEGNAALLTQSWDQSMAIGGPSFSYPKVCLGMLMQNVGNFYGGKRKQGEAGA